MGKKRVIRLIKQAGLEFSEVVRAVVKGLAAVTLLGVPVAAAAAPAGGLSFEDRAHNAIV